MDTFQLAERVGELLRGRDLTLALAESCTGGLIGDLITDVPGSSHYFLGGVVAYSGRIKQGVLGVQAETLAEHGEVSAQTAREMALGARRLLDADVAASVTGIAGPGGAMPGKPLGLTYFHICGPHGEIGRQARWSGDRQANKRHSAEAVLRLVIDYLEQ